MNDMTVTEVSKIYGVSTRMLRYYEKEGLIASKHKDDYAYRVYDETAIKRLKQVLLLRKLRFSLKDIQQLLNLADQSDALAVFLKHIAELEKEIASVNVIRDILRELVNGGAQRPLLYLESDRMNEVVDALPSLKSTLKEAHSMKELNEANEAMDQIKAENVRIMMLPPFTVAAYQFIGPEPETKAGDMMSNFIRKSCLYERKPDARMFGFNHPNPKQPGDEYGYEVWVTIPEEMVLPEPIVKKQFPGGLFAVLTIDFPEFWRWKSLFDWVSESEKYDINFHPLGEEIMGGCLEEHLNWVYSAHMGWPENGIDGKLDLMLPIRIKEGQA